MLATFLLVFREVLEASLVVGVAAAALRGVAARRNLIAGGLALGIAGAVGVAFGAALIANALGGLGQELLNATVLFSAAALIAWHVLWMARHGKGLSKQIRQTSSEVSSGAQPLTAIMLVVAAAVLREGSEVVLFGYSLFIDGSSRSSLITGASLGLAAGVALGFVVYFGLLNIPLKHFFRFTNGLLVLLACGMSASAASFLVQADLLPPLISPMWNTSWLLGDDSAIGRAMHALVGYSAQPSGTQVAFYLVSMVLLSLAMFTLRAVPSGKQSLSGQGQPLEG
jgi:high-affinity iron transporter